MSENQPIEQPNTPVTDAPNGAPVTGAAAFRERSQKRTHGEVIQLSSGVSVRIKRPSISGLIKTGQLPSELASAAVKIQSGAATTSNDMKMFVEYNERIAKLSLIEPRVVDNPNYDNNEISFDDLEDGDQTEILLYVNGGLDALAKFREERSGATA